MALNRSVFQAAIMPIRQRAVGRSVHGDFLRYSAVWNEDRQPSRAWSIRVSNQFTEHLCTVNLPYMVTRFRNQCRKNLISLSNPRGRAEQTLVYKMPRTPQSTPSLVISPHHP